jgi:hypothetical protein
VFITISLYKSWVFMATAIILLLSGWVLFRPGRACPSDPALAAACELAYSWNVRFFWGSVVIWVIGFFTAFILPLLYTD